MLRLSIHDSTDVATQRPGYLLAISLSSRIMRSRLAEIHAHAASTSWSSMPPGNPTGIVAEEEGFEPPSSRPQTVFKTAGFNHSPIPPIIILLDSTTLRNRSRPFARQLSRMTPIANRPNR